MPKDSEPRLTHPQTREDVGTFGAMLLPLIPKQVKLLVTFGTTPPVKGGALLQKSHGYFM